MAELRGKIKEKEKRDKYLDLARQLKKAMENKGDDDTYCNGCGQNDPPKVWIWRRKSLKSEDKLRPSKLEHC